MIGLLVDVQFASGRRAGAIDPRGRDTVCSPQWQNTSTGKEVRLLRNEADEAKYEGVDGIVVLDGAAAIDEAVLSLQPGPTYAIASEALLAASIVQKKIDISQFSHELSHSEECKCLYELGASGIEKSQATPPTACETCEAWGIPL